MPRRPTSSPAPARGVVATRRRTTFYPARAAAVAVVFAGLVAAGLVGTRSNGTGVGADGLATVAAGAGDPTRAHARGAAGPSVSGGRSSKPAVTAPPPCTNAGVVAGWPMARQASAVLMLSVAADQLASVTPLLRDGVGGMLITGTSAAAGLASGLAALRTAAGAVPPLFGIDEEGGRVRRLGSLLPSFPSSRDQAASLTPAQVQQEAAQVGTALHDLGITMDFAPDADLNGGPWAGAIGDRSFSDDPVRAATYAAAFAKGLEGAGVTPVAKHFPGHGHADGDTDVKPAVTPPLDALRAADLRPFASLIQAGIPAVMVGHLTVPGLTEARRPASLSPATMALLRNELGFRGLIVTDSLSMGAISRTGLSVPEAAVDALEAGADLILFTSNEDAPPAVGAIAAAVASGALPPARLHDAISHILTVKGVDLCAPGAHT